MTKNKDNQENLEARFKEVKEENDFLLRQLHQVQEELENLYLRTVASESNAPIEIDWADDDLRDIFAENKRLQALVEVQKKVHQLETHNSLSVKLGNVLMQSVDSPISFLGVPGKLGKIWRESSRSVPLKSLGGEGFEKIISMHKNGGFAAVTRIMEDAAVSEVMQANAYTVLARSLMKSDRAGAAEAARFAYTLDPKPYRLKWLAFRLHESGDVIEAEAMLDILPADMQFSDSEVRQAGRLRYEAKHARQHEAAQSVGVSERRAEFMGQLKNLARERDKLLILAEESERETKDLQQKKEQLEKDKAALEAGSRSEVLSLKKVIEQLEIDKNNLEKAANDLQQEKAQLEKDKATLEVESRSEVLSLKKVIEQLEIDKNNLEKAANREVETLRRVIEQKESDNTKRENIVEKLEREIESLKQATEQLEADKTTLIKRHEEDAKLIEEHRKKIHELQKQVQDRQADEAALAERRQLHEEMLRAEAQLELIKDVLLRESEL